MEDGDAEEEREEEGKGEDGERDAADERPRGGADKVVALRLPEDRVLAEPDCGGVEDEPAQWRG